MEKKTLLVHLIFLISLLLGRSASQVSIDGPDSISAYVEENSPAGTLVTDLHAAVSSGATPTWSIDPATHFNISSDGEVQVSALLDIESLFSPYHFVVTITATADGGSDTVSLTIIVQDVNDNPPVFENTATNSDLLILPENEATGTIIYSMIVSDPDTGGGGNFHFSYPSADANFDVSYFSGDITLIQSLDHETNTQHVLTVLIEDEGVPSLTTTVVITVNVTNQPDSAPVISKKLHLASIPESDYSVTPSTIATIVATDAEFNLFAVIKYSLVDNGQSWINLFTVDESSGVVMVVGVLDRETRSRYVFQVKATEYQAGGVVPIDAPPAVATVVLTVTDVNDNAPQFYSQTYTGYVPEDANIGHIVLASIEAFDIDEASNAVFTYRIPNRAMATGNNFDIGPDTGVISVTGSLDHESANTYYSFVIEAVEPVSQPEPKTGTASVAIHVQNVNDQAPYFLVNDITYTIRENQPPTAFTPTLQAVDKDDVAAMLSFELKGVGTAPPNEHFTYTQVNNTITISTLGQLDREDIDMYHIVVIVQDSSVTSLSGTADVYINVTDDNDNPPVFAIDEYFLEIAEQNAYSNCLAVQAEDVLDTPENAGITYSLSVLDSSPNTDTVSLESKFEIDSITGMVHCFAIDHENMYHNITLQVLATDSGTIPLTDTATIYVTVEDLNEHAPIFDQASYATTIAEDHVVGTAIGVTVLATEAGDVGLDHPITYSIVGGGNTGGALAVDGSTGVVILANPVDWETLNPNPLVVMVMAADLPDSSGTILSSTTTIYVTVTDVNEHTPSFTNPIGLVTITVSEGDSVPKSIITMTATDPDGSSDGELTFSFTPPPYGMFMIDSATWTLVMTNPPDREMIPGNAFPIILTVSDQPTNPANALTSNATIIIQVTDINDNAPVFNPASYSASIPEDTAGSVVLFTVFAEDTQDIGVNAEVEYSIQSVTPGAGSSKFLIEASSGIVRTGPNGFDFEDPTDINYSIVIIARDLGESPKSATATATVVILNVDDEPPIFSSSFYDAGVNEVAGSNGMPVDIDVITTIAVTDLDSTVFSYSIVDSSKTNGWFDINPNSGVIYIPNGTVIDRESSGNLINSAGQAVVIFDIQVSDGQLTDTAEVTIYINDVNDNPPVFADSSLTTGVPESVPMGTVVDFVMAIDADFGANANFTYAKTSGDTSGLFDVHPITGKITVQAPVDVDQGLGSVSFVITATDQAGLSSDITVNVEITDVNDNSPIFDPTFYEVTVLEVTTMDELLEIVNASDADQGTNGEISYAIVGGNINSAFYIKDPLEGDVRVYDPSVIDREMLTFYRLIVVATDNAFPSTYQRTAVAEVVILIGDVNDNSPIFPYSTYVGSIMENSPNNSFVPLTPSIMASDADIGTNADITYDIESGFPFRIDPDTGFVYTSDIDIDRESKDFHILTVIARDGGGKEGSAIVQINVTDVNDNPPILNILPDITIPENFTVGDTVSVASATDADAGINRVITFSLLGGEGFFQIDSATGEITLIQSLLSLEKREDFDITVMAVDGGIVSMSDSEDFDIAVSDVNDNAPEFDVTGFGISVIESMSVPSQLVYSPPITASDIDDGSNADIEFVAAPDSSPFFSVTTTSGIAEIRLTSSLDRESIAFHTIKILAQDLGNPQLTSQVLEVAVTVTDANDNPPIFAQELYATNISEFTSDDTPLLLLSASDNDTGSNAAILYEISDMVPPSTLFKVDQVTGLILTDDYVDETYTETCFELTITAKDQGSPQLSSTTLAVICITDVNQPLVFDMTFYTFTVVENQPVGTFVGTVVATDPDPMGSDNSNIQFSLATSPSEEGFFTINATSGVITTIQPLDYEDRKLHVMSVIAQDSGQNGFQHTNFATVVVNVTDLNDNSPQLQFNSFNTEYIIKEDIPLNTTIATFVVTDADHYPNNIVIFKILDDYENLFHIGEISGILTTAALEYDREQFTQYSITIAAYNIHPSTEGLILDLDKNDTVLITFTITDVNDNAPVFTMVPNNTCIKENSLAGTAVGLFGAYDADEEINSKLFFSIDPVTNVGDAFVIGSLDGNLTVLNQADYDTLPIDNKQFALTVLVVDLGSPQLSADPVQLIVCIEDVNDNGPVFDVPNPKPILLGELSQAGVLLYHLNVTDMDDPPYDQSILKLVAGNEDGIFMINPSDNALYLQNSSLLDAESDVTSYVVTVVASDYTNPFLPTSTATLTILIMDENDHPPVFDEPEYSLFLAENTETGLIITHIIATDEDATVPNNVFMYSFGSGDLTYNDTFEINPGAGTIMLIGPLDYDFGPKSYNLTIKVQDEGMPAFTSTVSLVINVEDVNDMAPIFIDPTPEISTLVISENTTVGYEVATIRAIDVDTGLGGIVTYSFSNQELVVYDPPVFKINRTSGVITLEATLDRESQKAYEFTVIASDSGVTKMEASISFTVQVGDVNDNVPIFISLPSTLSVFEDHGLTEANAFDTVEGDDKDDSDSDSIYFYTNENGKFSECGSFFCVGHTSGNLYLGMPLDRETQDNHNVMVVVSNSPNPVDAANNPFNSLSLSILVLDVNDNTPQFVVTTIVAGVSEEAEFGSEVTTIVATDADISSHGEVWYRIERAGTSGTPFTVNTFTGEVTTAATSIYLAGTHYTMAVIAYDNEGNSPSNENQTSLDIYAYDESTNIVILTINRTIDIAEPNRNYYTKNLTEIIGELAVIAEIRVKQSDAGSVDRSGTDILFFAVDVTDDTLFRGTDVLILVESNYQKVQKMLGDQDPEFRLPPVVEESFPSWIWVIIALLCLAILLVGFACCIFVVVEKRRNRKLKQEAFDSSYSAFSKSSEYSSTSNPLWVSPMLNLETTSISSSEAQDTVEQLNPVYEEQEVTLEMIDDDDFDEEPPGSQEDIPSLKYRASASSDELLAYAIGLPARSSSPSKTNGRVSLI